jgi:hypothetical protein
VELLEKETLDLVDILRILGDRPFPLSDTMKDYMKEVEMRREEHKKKLEEKKEQQDKDQDKNKDDKNKEDDDDKKSDEFDKDRDLKGKDKDKKEGSGGRLPPRGPEERDINEAETIMKESESKK